MRQRPNLFLSVILIFFPAPTSNIIFNYFIFPHLMNVTFKTSIPQAMFIQSLICMEMPWFLTSVHCHSTGYQKYQFPVLIQIEGICHSGAPGLLNIEITWKDRYWKKLETETDKGEELQKYLSVRSILHFSPGAALKNSDQYRIHSFCLSYEYCCIRVGKKKLNIALQTNSSWNLRWTWISLGLPNLYS